MRRINKILAFIPARGGSKGVPRKNILDIGGQPLIAWTIKAAKKSKYIDMALVSSDDVEILSIADRYGALPLKRPKDLATDTVRVEKSVSHALAWLKKNKNYIPDVVVYLQPTSPMRDHADIDNALDLFFEKKADALISVYPINKSYLKSFKLNSYGFLKPAVKKTFSFSNRQELPDIYMPDGALYITKTNVFLKDEYLFGRKTLPYFMPSWKTVDIDHPEDVVAVRKIIKKHLYAKEKK